MNSSKTINIIRTISLLAFIVNAIILGCNVFEVFSFPDAVIRISGVITLIAICLISFTTVKKAQDTKETKH